MGLKPIPHFYFTGYTLGNILFLVVIIVGLFRFSMFVALKLSPNYIETKNYNNDKSQTRQKISITRFRVDQQLENYIVLAFWVS